MPRPVVRMRPPDPPCFPVTPVCSLTLWALFFASSASRVDFGSELGPNRAEAKVIWEGRLFVLDSTGLVCLVFGIAPDPFSGFLSSVTSLLDLVKSSLNPIVDVFGSADAAPLLLAGVVGSAGAALLGCSGIFLGSFS